MRPKAIGVNENQNTYQEKKAFKDKNTLIDKNTVNSIDQIEVMDTELLIIGGGAAGIMAAVRAREICPEIDTIVVEKAHVERSGCLAAGINAINAHLNPGETPESFLAYIKDEFAGVVREDLVYSLARRLNEMTECLEAWGLPILKDKQGQYVPRGRASIRINGESIKPIMAGALIKSGARVLNHTVVTGLIKADNRIVGALVFGLKDGIFRAIRAGAVIIATGGASGIYRANHTGFARHKTWYSPFNTGAGLAMAYRAGAELTSLEMRFVALRVKDTLAPTGTLAQGVKAVQINGRYEPYLERYRERGKPSTTADRLWATLEENRAGRGPCYLDTRHLNEEQGRLLKAAYLNMCPSQVLIWAERNQQPHESPVEITGSEPYIVGGHGMAGLWVDKNRQTTVPGLYAVGDAAGGAPKKYVTGAMAEGAIAAETAVKELMLKSDWKTVDEIKWQEAMATEYQRSAAPLAGKTPISPQEAEEKLQDLMDQYAGGITRNYLYEEAELIRARIKLAKLELDCREMKAANPYELMLVHQVWDRILLARALVEHMSHRKESRWPVYQNRKDYSKRDDRRWRVFVNSCLTEQGQCKIIERSIEHLNPAKEIVGVR